MKFRMIEPQFFAVPAEAGFVDSQRWSAAPCWRTGAGNRSGLSEGTISNLRRTDQTQGSVLAYFSTPRLTARPLHHGPQESENRSRLRGGSCWCQDIHVPAPRSIHQCQILPACCRCYSTAATPHFMRGRINFRAKPLWDLKQAQIVMSRFTSSLFLDSLVLKYHALSPMAHMPIFIFNKTRWRHLYVPLAICLNNQFSYPLNPHCGKSSGS
jgi:hypothetical protein